MYLANFSMISLRAAWAAAMVCAGFGFQAEAKELAVEAAPGVATARMLFLPEDLERLDAPVDPGSMRITVTGAYTSADAPRPEGFTIRSGDPTRPWPQGWDGLLVIDEKGRARIFDVSHVDIGGTVYNLREDSERKAFVELARKRGYSAVQSHLLIRDGALDVSPIADAPIARRRLIFQTQDGRIGIYDSAPNGLTLYEAAVAIQAEVGAVMAFNLDMGTYDFCEIRTGGGVETCGLLGRGRIERLTNLFEITLPLASSQ